MAIAAARLPTRLALLDAGRAIVLADGFQALTVRRVAAAAHANVGSFVYHFGSRDRFVCELIEAWYEPVMAGLSLVVDAEAAPVARLRLAVLQLIDFAIAEDVFLGRLLNAAIASDAPARRFLGSLAGRHPRILIKLIRAAQSSGAIVDDDPVQVLMFIMSTVGLPRLLSSAWNGPPLFEKTLAATLSRMSRDRTRIVQRLSWALRGLTPESPS
jgi:AcrR family transcriptional regulator